MFSSGNKSCYWLGEAGLQEIWSLFRRGEDYFLFNRGHLIYRMASRSSFWKRNKRWFLWPSSLTILTVPDNILHFVVIHREEQVFCLQCQGDHWIKLTLKANIVCTCRPVWRRKYHFKKDIYTLFILVTTPQLVLECLSMKILLGGRAYLLS